MFHDWYTIDLKTVCWAEQSQNMRCCSKTEWFYSNFYIFWVCRLQVLPRAKLLTGCKKIIWLLESIFLDIYIYISVCVFACLNIKVFQVLYSSSTPPFQMEWSVAMTTIAVSQHLFKSSRLATCSQSLDFIGWIFPRVF